MAGAQGLHTNSKDEALSLPTVEAVKLALRTQQVIAYESGITDTVDPLGGSYYLEYLTDELESKIESYIEKIAGFGPDMLEAVTNALEQGFFHTELSNSAYAYHREVMDKSKIVVGVNKFEEAEKLKVEIFKADPTARERQAERLKKIRKERNNGALNNSLSRLAFAIEKEENLYPYVLDAVKNYGTLGEITKIMTDVYGRYRDICKI